MSVHFEYVCLFFSVLCSSLTGDDGSTCIPITASNVVIVASRDSSIDSKARGSNKVCWSVVPCYVNYVFGYRHVMEC